MNKYLGFYELKALGIPTIPWNEYTKNTKLSEDKLWTIRVAVENSNDLNLPRFVGITSNEAKIRGEQLLQKYKYNGIVIYYPYFWAEKSGVMDINKDRIVIEAVKDDLWNLVTYGNKDVTIKIINDSFEYIGDKQFLNSDEIEELIKYANIIKSKYRDLIIEGQSLFVEWSYARKSDNNSKPIGERYLVFYEIRSV